MRAANLSWLHVSDFHLGKDPAAQKQTCDRILDEIYSVTASWREPDFIFITGDVANRGLSEEFEAFDKNFIVPLVDKLGDKFLARVFVVPGNHDVDRTQAKAVRRYDVLQEVPNFLDPTPEGASERAPLFPRFVAFNECQWTFENVGWVTASDGFLARKIQLDETNVGVLCLNTAWLSGGDDDRYRLTPGKDIVEGGLQQLSGCRPIFVLGHHPLDWLTVADAKNIRAMLSKREAIYLHGHLHKTEQSALYSGTRRLVTLQAGCAFFARADEKWVTRLLWGGMNQPNSEIFLQPKKWMPEHHEWGLDADAFPDSLRAAGSDYWIIPSLAPVGQTADQSSIHKQIAKRDASPPEGWVMVDAEYLSQQVPETQDVRILQYFDGRVPIWGRYPFEENPTKSHSR